MDSVKKSKVQPAASTASIDPRTFGLTKAAYSVNETLDVLSIGRTSLYKLVNGGALRPAKLGKKTLFFAADITAFLIKLREAA
jgi:Helix-turn-helix domain